LSQINEASFGSLISGASSSAMPSLAKALLQMTLLVLDMRSERKTLAILERRINI